MPQNRRKSERSLGAGMADAGKEGLMGYAVYESKENNRWQGYGVPGVCDHLWCDTPINLGMGYLCEGEEREYGPDECQGCGGFYCSEHQSDEHGDRLKPNTREWLTHMLTDPSWQAWRDENPERVHLMREEAA